MKSRCVPKRSAARPPSSRNPPNVSRYAFTTHASEVSEKPRSCGGAPMLASNDVLYHDPDRAIAAALTVVDKVSTIDGDLSFSTSTATINSSGTSSAAKVR